MTREEFEKLVGEGFGRLPQWVRKKIKNVALLVEDEPSKDDRRAQGLADDETLLGLYKGIPLSERGELYGVGATMPDTITLYQQPIEDVAADELNLDFVNPNLQNQNIGRNPKHAEAVRKVVADTIWHEFAHHFGMDEGEVQARERRRDGDVIE